MKPHVTIKGAWKDTIRQSQEGQSDWFFLNILPFLSANQHKHHMVRPQSFFLSLQFPFSFSRKNSLPEHHYAFKQNKFLGLDVNNKINYNKKDKLSMKKDDFYRILDEYSYAEEDESFEQMHYEKQLARAINSHVFQGEPFSTTLPNERHTMLTAKIEVEDTPPPLPAPPTEQSESFKEITSEVQKISVEDPLENSSFAFTPDCLMRRSQSEDLPKPPKNQYDKNIFANICKTVIREMLGGRYEEQIREYCLVLGVDYSGFLDIFGKMDRQCMRMGTSQLNHFLHSQQISLGVRKAFSFFFVRYLRDEYVGYVAHQGKMRDKQKYLRCACKMMYIPQLSRNEYRLLEASVRPLRL